MNLKGTETTACRVPMKTYAVEMLNKTEKVIHFLSHPTIYQDTNKEHLAYLKGVSNALASIVQYEDMMDGSLTQ